MRVYERARGGGELIVCRFVVSMHREIDTKRARLHAALQVAPRL